MTQGRDSALLFSIPVGMPFLPGLAEALLSGRLIPGFPDAADPLSLASATIYVPTRRAARELRAAFAALGDPATVLLPVIRPLGEFDEDAVLFEPDPSPALPPPVATIERVLLLAPLIRAWKQQIPRHVAAKFEGKVVVPASSADAIWMARELAAFMDEAETGGMSYAALAGLTEDSLAEWWQVTLDFLRIVTEHWPAILAQSNRSNPAVFRNAAIEAETARLARNPAGGPVIVAGSTGSIPAIAGLIAAIVRLPNGCAVLPGLSMPGELGEEAWQRLSAPLPDPSDFGHPQFGLAKLLRAIGFVRDDVMELGAPAPALAARSRLIAGALLPAGSTHIWAGVRPAAEDGAFDGVTLLEAASEREEAAAIAVALRLALADPGKTAALVTPDRILARRVAAEMQRFGIKADDSGGAPLSSHAGPAFLLSLAEAVFAPGNAVSILDVVKSPLFRLGHDVQAAAALADVIELAVLRGGTGRPDIVSLGRLMDDRLKASEDARHKPLWRDRISAEQLAEARALCTKLETTFAPLASLRDTRQTGLKGLLQASASVLEDLARGPEGDPGALYEGDGGEAFASFLRNTLASSADLDIEPREWPDVLAALMAPETVKPSAGASGRLHIWGTLEARLQTVDLLVLGGLNEGTWPAAAEPGQFLSRMMKGELALEPPERRIGQAAHDFQMACGQHEIVLSRSARSGDSPSVTSRWLQRLEAFCGKDALAGPRRRGAALAAAAHGLDLSERVAPAARPGHAPPIAARPKHFSVTEIEILRRDPYAIYARRVLGLSPLEPLLRDPEAAERGRLLHAIIEKFDGVRPDETRQAALSRLLETGAAVFSDAALPGDVHAVWWPRFAAMAPEFIQWDQARREGVLRSLAEVQSAKVQIGATGVTLAGRADRIDLLAGDEADILDFKTGSSPSKKQAHTLLAPQLALEGALLARGAFAEAGNRKPHDLAHVRLKAKGEVTEESILVIGRRESVKSGPEISEEAWSHLEKLVASFADPAQGYRSRVLPFREREMDGDYDHLARVLEWSSGSDGEQGEDDGEDEA